MGYRFWGAGVSLWTADAKRGNEHAERSASSTAARSDRSVAASQRTMPAERMDERAR